MLIKLRQHIVYGLQLSQDSSRTLRYTNQKAEKVSQELIITVCPLTNAENTTAVAATINSWSIFAGNIDFSGTVDPQ